MAAPSPNTNNNTVTLTLKVRVDDSENEDCYDMKDCLFASRNDVGADLIREVLIQFIDVVYSEEHCAELAPFFCKSAVDLFLNFEHLSWRRILQSRDDDDEDSDEEEEDERDVYAGYVMFDVQIPPNVGKRQVVMEFNKLFTWYSTYMLDAWKENGYTFDVARINL